MQKKGNFDGDLNIKVSVKKSNIFIRENNNVKTELQIDAIDAILGTKMEITTIEGKKVTINILQGVQPGEKITLSGEGFRFMNSNKKGDHIITVKIVVPKHISSQEKSIY